MDGAGTVHAERVLVVAPTAADAALTRTLLGDAGLACAVCNDFDGLRGEIANGAGAILLTDEVLAASDQRSLVEALEAQPPWSDIPVILLSAGGIDSDAAIWSAAGVGTVTVLERPVRVTTLLSALRSAIRARKRQYQLRDQLEELKLAGASLRQQTERLQLLWFAAALMLAADDPAQTMRALFDRLAPHFDLDAYLHYRADDVDSALRLATAIGVAQEAAAAITRIDAADDPVARLMRREGIRAYALCPMFAAGRLVGTLSFGSRGKERFDVGETEFLRTIAQYVSVATERVRLIRELRETDRRKDEFLATLAHELRNPLAPIRNALHIMELARDDAAALARGRVMMERQLGHMVRLIDDLLDVSRITRGKLELRKERLDLAAIVHDALDTARPLIEAAGHHFTVSLPAEPVYLDADPVRLAQVLSNVLNNAAKYTERGGRIVLSARRLDGEVVLTLSDNGIGISPESLPRIFDMFSQADRSPGRSQGGLGIGLTLVKSLVEMHGGRVRVSSGGIGKGTEVVIHLPTVRGPALATARDEEQLETPTPIACRVLVADDNGDAAESMGAMLRLMGNEVRTVRDGTAALYEAEAFRPDVVVLDIGMPGLDGYEVARRIRRARWGKEIVLVALTGWGQDEDKRRAIEAGFDRHFTKPVSPRKIHELFAGLRDVATAPARADAARASPPPV